MRFRKPAVSLALSSVLIITSAAAQERPAVVSTVEAQPPRTPAVVAAGSIDVLELTTQTLRYSPSMMSELSLSSPLHLSSPQDIRLSHGAKTAIIVTAIIVGVLIIVGVVVIAKPHKHL